MAWQYINARFEKIERQLEMHDRSVGYVEIGLSRLKDDESSSQVAHKKAINKHIDKKHSQLRNGLKKILAKHYIEIDRRVSRVENSYIDIKHLEKMMQAQQTGLQNVYNQFKELQDGTGLKTILEVQKDIYKNLESMNTFDCIVMNRMKELYGMSDDYDKRIKELREDMWAEIEKLRKEK